MKQIFVIFIAIYSTISIYSQNLPSEVTTALAGKDANSQLDILLDFGKQYEKKSDVSNSVNCYKSAADIYKNSGAKDGEAYCLNKAGKVYLKAKKYGNAITEFSKSKKLYSSINDNKNTYNVAFNIGDSYMYQKKYKNAINSYKQAYDLIKNNSDNKAKAYILNQIGTAYAGWGNNKEAINYLKKAEGKAKLAGLSDMQNSISANIEALQENLANKEEHITEYDIEKKEEEKQYVENLKSDFEATKQDHLMSLKEIEKLSFENQAKQYKLHAMNEKYEKEVAENKLKEAKIKNLENEKIIQKLELEQKEIKIANQQKTLLIIGSGSIVLGLLLIYIIVLYRQKRKNLVLVQKQKEEINEKNAVLSQANEEIAAQRDELEEQKEVLNKQNIEITDSIKYAEKIQNSILPSKQRILKFIPNFFVLFKPKNIVSGDFYWFYKRGDEFWGAIVDCTGHGVPGAFMSMIGNSLLNKIILEPEVKTPADLLKRLNKELDYALNQNRGGENSDDGMDMTVININKKAKNITISLANHNAIVIKDDKVNRIEGDIFSIGGLFYSEDTEFTNHNVEMKTGTSLYMFSDGFQDQFGGENNKKYSIEQMESKLLSIQDKTIQEQEGIMNTEFENWKSYKDQIDDVLLVGISF